MGRAISLLMIVWLSVFALGTWSQAADKVLYQECVRVGMNQIAPLIKSTAFLTEGEQPNAQEVTVTLIQNLRRICKEASK